MKTVLTIAGSDSIGGAGIQADIKSISANGCYAMSVITSVTAQNTFAVTGIHDIPADFVKAQTDAVFEDIIPDAVKIGMLSSAEIICAVADELEKYGAKNVVADTVMISTSGCRLLAEDAENALVSRVFPLADIITPNKFEAEVLTGITIDSKESMENAGERLSEMCAGAVLIKGGHLNGDAADLLYAEGKRIWINESRIDNPNTHGTGCTLSSAIAANLAKGYSVQESIRAAKAYITGAIADGLDLGKGHGPLNHFYKGEILT